MPGGVPVACVGIGPGGAKNAALLAAQILGLTTLLSGNRSKPQTWAGRRLDVLHTAQQTEKQHPMIARYCRPQMKKVWSDKTKFDTWLKVEIAVYRHGQSAIPKSLAIGQARLDINLMSGC